MPFEGGEKNVNIDLQFYEITIIPAIVFLIRVATQIGMPKKFAPVIALILGVLAGLFFVGFTPEGGLTGILLAAASIGAHSGTKNIMQGGNKHVR